MRIIPDRVKGLRYKVYADPLETGEWLVWDKYADEFVPKLTFPKRDAARKWVASRQERATTVTVRRAL